MHILELRIYPQQDLSDEDLMALAEEVTSTVEKRYGGTVPVKTIIKETT